MNEKKYLKWYHKVGYGAGNIAEDCVFALQTAIVMTLLPCFIKISKKLLRKSYR